ncbi:MarR family winged helix-turn-helix transcriptional regulator [Bordetella sp. LUAb4]|uniref:MarR family winged helix-turn-helix transcriptional regulator n=1 Tax=Bordetella sp. LUAb4 TaxID=2843195 RepID=UPI001E5BAA24|nr:MarR family transcriptional regulator [Bordetella sp. LUAb4]
MKHYSPESFAKSQSVAFSLNRARNVMVMQMDAALKEFDISGQQFGLMMALRRGEASTPFELSKQLRFDSGSMTRMLDKLETKGLIARQRSVEDRRVVNLLITEHGEQVMQQALRIAPEVLNARLAHFTKEEFKEFNRLLAKFSEGA